MFAISTCLDTNYTHKAASSALGRMARCTAEFSAFRSVHFQVSEACIITAVTASFWCASPRLTPPFFLFSPSLFGLIFLQNAKFFWGNQSMTSIQLFHQAKFATRFFTSPPPFLYKVSIIKIISFTKYHLSSMPQPSFHRVLPTAMNRIKASN